MKVPISIPVVDDQEAREMPLNISASVAEHRIARLHADRGSDGEVMYEHCFDRIQKDIRSRMEEDACPLIGFSGEVVEPLNCLTLPLTLRYVDRVIIVHLRFSVIRLPSKYNVILGKSGLKALRASTLHGYLKFHIPKNVATIRPRKRIATNRERAKILVRNGSSRRISGVDDKDRAQLSDKGKTGLKEMLLRNTNAFAWKHKDMTGVP